jgi:hypothetical protein
MRYRQMVNYIPDSEQEAVAVAKELLALTDYAVLPDVNITNTRVFMQYRKELRGVIKNPFFPIRFKVPPEPIWAVEDAENAVAEAQQSTMT